MQSTAQGQSNDYIPYTVQKDSSGTIHSCSLCGSRFRSRREIEMHLKSNHSDLFSDSEMSSVSNSLAYHSMNFVLYQCEFCPYKTNQKNNLIRHNKTHTGDRPFKCQFCSYRAALRTSLVIHERTHTGVRPFKCKICSYSAAQRTPLVAHIEKHHSS